MRASSAPPSRSSRPSRPSWTGGVPVRLAFCVVWVGVQAALILTASSRADAAFGFRMFAESSTIRASLSREVEAPSGHGTTLVPVKNGEWVARGPDGYPHQLKWRDRVLEPTLGTFDTTMQAGYSAAAQQERWHAALDDVAAHLDGDAETQALHLVLTVRRNGHDPTEVYLTALTGGSPLR